MQVKRVSVRARPRPSWCCYCTCLPWFHTSTAPVRSLVGFVVNVFQIQGLCPAPTKLSRANENGTASESRLPYITQQSTQRTQRAIVLRHGRVGGFCMIEPVPTDAAAMGMEASIQSHLIFSPQIDLRHNTISPPNDWCIQTYPEG